MEELLLDILRAIREDGGFDEHALKRLIDEHNHRAGSAERRFAKRKVLPYYLRVKEDDPDRWRSWNVTGAEEAELFRLCRMKPRRTASGVATITVITKPWACSSNCLYCPNDVRMPKSYLHAEPACQRAERSCFDPYLQVASRLHALLEMGHPCDKIELIVLGGTWTDYPQGYQVWFVEELFRALNDDAGARTRNMRERRAWYASHGIAHDPDKLEAYTRAEQAEVDAHRESFASAIAKLYGARTPWEEASHLQECPWDELFAQQRANERARHRCVGLVVETRPDCIDAQTLVTFRKLGCTKVQVGVQSLRQEVLDANGRHITPARIREAFELLRLFGFKVHAHFMVNLLGSTPEGDVEDYRRFVTDPAFCPDEIKLYPCALIGGTGLVARYEDGSWRPYDEETLVSVLGTDVLNTPCFCRVSRMIRDFSAGDIVAGNKKTNLRQLVEGRLREQKAPVREIRYRELGLDRADPASLRLEVFSYGTTATRERFLQWVTPHDEIVGFLRLSIPRAEALHGRDGELPVHAGEAMIREVHVYGSAARIGHREGGAQHLGLGRKLVARACEIARAEGCTRMHVISAVGTREYYRGLGFVDDGLYQSLDLRDSPGASCQRERLYT